MLKKNMGLKKDNRVILMKEKLTLVLKLKIWKFTQIRQFIRSNSFKMDTEIAATLWVDFQNGA